MILWKLNGRGANCSRRCERPKCKYNARYRFEWSERVFQRAHTRKLRLCRTHKDEFMLERKLIVIKEQLEPVATGHERYCS